MTLYPNYSMWITEDKVSGEITILAFPFEIIFIAKYLHKYIVLELAVYHEYIFRYSYSGKVHPLNIFRITLGVQINVFTQLHLAHRYYFLLRVIYL